MPVNYDIELRLSYLRAALSAIEAEEDAIQAARAFYAGEQGVLLTDRQKEYLDDDIEAFANICKRAIRILTDRLEIPEDGIGPADETSQDYADTARQWWTDITEADTAGDSDANGMQGGLYEAAMRDGATAVIVGWDDKRGKPTFTQNLIYDGETGLVRFHYDSNGALLFASKRWTVWDPLNPGETGKRRLTIYTPGYIERFEADGTVAGGWRPLDDTPEAPNPQPWTDTGTFSGEPLGIPVIPYDNGESELSDILAIQQMINHNVGTMDISIDYAGFPILYTVNGDFPIDSATGQAKMPSFQPGTAINLADGGSAGRIEAADLQKLFEGGIINLVQLIALVKGWPMWLFDRTQAAPSGVALQTMEQSLVAQVRKKQAAFGSAWRSAFNIARKLHKLKTGQDLPGQILFRWRDPQTTDELAHLSALEKKFIAGEVPVIQRWLELGYSLDEVETLLQYKQREDDFGLADTVTGISQ